MILKRPFWPGWPAFDRTAEESNIMLDKHHPFAF